MRGSILEGLESPPDFWLYKRKSDGRGWVRTSDLSRVRRADGGSKKSQKPAFPSGMKHLPPPIP